MPISLIPAVVTPFNPHAPGPIGDVTPSTIKGVIATSTNATTGLTAGVLSALTTASIVIYDGTGTAYRVPCITP